MLCSVVGQHALSPRGNRVSDLKSVVHDNNNNNNIRRHGRLITVLKMYIVGHGLLDNIALIIYRHRRINTAKRLQSSASVITPLYLYYPERPFDLITSIIKDIIILRCGTIENLVFYQHIWNRIHLIFFLIKLQGFRLGLIANITSVVGGLWKT